MKMRATFAAFSHTDASPYSVAFSSKVTQQLPAVEMAIRNLDMP